jgi:hypothetical protein
MYKNENEKKEIGNNRGRANRGEQQTKGGTVAYICGEGN